MAIWGMTKKQKNRTPNTEKERCTTLSRKGIKDGSKVSFYMALL